MKKAFQLVAILFFVFVSVSQAQACRWVRSEQKSGNGIYQSRVFRLGGERWRLEYSGPGPGYLHVFLYRKDGALLAQLVNAKYTASTHDTAYGYVPEYWDEGYLVVKGNDRGWKINLDFYVSDVDAWELNRFERAQLDPTNPRNLHYGEKQVGIWMGNGGEEMEIPLEISSAHWRINAEAFAQGRLKYEILNEEGRTIGIDYLLSPSKKESWVHQRGKFVLRISSVATPWCVVVRR